MAVCNNFNFKIRSLQVLNLLVSLAGLTWLFSTGASASHWLALAFLFFFLFGFFGINIGLHRLFAHRVFKTHEWTTRVLTLLSVLATVGSPLAWVGLHRIHHKNSDQPKDPHSPHHIGSFRAWWGIWNHVLIPPHIVRDLLNSRFHRKVHRNYFRILIAYIALLAIIHPALIVFAYSLPATLCLHGTSAVSVWGHHWGYRNFDCSDHSRNSWLLWLASLGEGWHNNHHHQPSALTSKVKPWELDPAAWFIKRFMKIDD